MPPPGHPEPTNVDIDREHSVTIEWEDGHVSRFGLEELRLSCHCAECRGLREQGVVVWPRNNAPEPLRVESAELVGAYGLSVAWNDLHSMGIYSWEMLREACHCPECVSGD
ncbi:MAG: DUF971 domain-containing protein [Acidimicrobiia bacterium]